MDPALLSTAMNAMPGIEGNPMLQSLMQVLVGLMKDDGEPADDLAAARRRLQARKRVAHIQRMMKNLHARNAFLANALGACDCWGADERCERCHGSGAPGWSEPSPAAFDALIVPLVQRHQALFRAQLRPIQRRRKPQKRTQNFGGENGRLQH